MIILNSAVGRYQLSKHLGNTEVKLFTLLTYWVNEAPLCGFAKNFSALRCVAAFAKYPKGIKATAIGCKRRLAEHAEISRKIRIQLLNLGSYLEDWVFRSHPATDSGTFGHPLFRASGAVLFSTATLKLETSSRTSG